MALTVDEIATLFASTGSKWYGGEAVTQLDHALQCAHLAEQAGESDETVAACLLHDLGHLVSDHRETPNGDKDDLHQYTAMPFLRSAYGDAVAEPIRLHVDAKRYLCNVDAAYWSTLSPASKKSLEIQGGRFDDEAAAQFIALPHAETAVRLRRYDDLAKQQGRETPPLEHYLRLLRQISA